MNSDIKICCTVMAGIALGFILIPAFHGGDTYFLMSSAQTANVSLALDDLTDVTIINVMDGQIIIYNSTSGQWENMNQTTVSDSTVCGNLGAGILICAGDNVQLKSLIAGTGISITNSSTTITIANTLPENTVCANVGSYAQVYKDGSCNFRTLKGSPDISIVQGTNDITFDYNGTLVTESTVCGNIGTGTIIHVVSSNCNAKSLKAGTGLSITNSSNSITYTNTGVISNSCSSGISCSGTNPSTFTNTSPESTVCSNIGTGTIVHVTSSNCNAKSFKAGTGLSIANTSNSITYTNTLPEQGCSSAGGTTLLKTDSTCVFKGLASGVGISITSNTNNNTISNTYSCSTTGIGSTLINASTTTGKNCILKGLSATYPITVTGGLNDITIACADCSIKGSTQIPREMGQVFVSKIMTNIGTTNVDIYTTAFDEEDMINIDCTNVIDLRVRFMWDYVGTGTQTVRWVDANNNANVLYSTTLIVDNDPGDSSWFTKPGWCTGVTNLIEMQGSSTVAGDDPVAKGYVLYAR